MYTPKLLMLQFAGIFGRSFHSNRNSKAILLLDLLIFIPQTNLCFLVCRLDFHKIRNVQLISSEQQRIHELILLLIVAVGENGNVLL